LTSDVTSVVRVIPASGGRELELLASGPEDGLPLVFHNGTPVGLVSYSPMVAAAAERGLRTVMYARPGYGRSTPAPDRTVADAATDVVSVLDALGAEQFVTAGWSGGGPHALACATLLPERCLAAASIAGVAPHNAAGLDWLAGMAEENVEEFEATAAGPDRLTAFLAANAAQLADVTGDQVAEGMGGLISAVDRAVLTGDFAEYLAAAFRAAVSDGIAGWRDDDVAFFRDWGFVLEPSVPVTIWQGDQDMMVPFAHGEWLAANVPGATVRLFRGEGHLSLGVSKFGDILDDLLQTSGVR
jgi:pimeloyl-ACP methyl ester carboxylesterase